MAAKYWLKLYYEMLDDAKVGKLAPDLRWRFIETLLVAGECDEDGFLPDIDQYAWRVRSDCVTIESDFASLAEAGLLSRAEGRWLVTKFKERQEPVSGAERVARFREREKKKEYYEPVTATLPNGNEPVTIRYTDTDKIREDKDKIIAATSAAGGFSFSKNDWQKFIDEAKNTLSRPTYQTYVETAEFERVELNGDLPLVVVKAKDQYAADWLNQQSSLSLLIGVISGQPAKLYARV